MKDSPERSGGTAKEPVAITESVVPELARAENARGSVGETPADALEAARRIVANLNRDGIFRFGALTPATDADMVARALLAPKAEGRDDVLEEAARLFQKYPHREYFGSTIVEKIRALKEKPHG